MPTRFIAAKVASRWAASLVATISCPVTGLPIRASQRASLAIACICMSMIRAGAVDAGDAVRAGSTRRPAPRPTSRRALVMAIDPPGASRPVESLAPLPEEGVRDKGLLDEPGA